MMLFHYLMLFYVCLWQTTKGTFITLLQILKAVILSGTQLRLNTGVLSSYWKTESSQSSELFQVSCFLFKVMCVKIYVYNQRWIKQPIVFSLYFLALWPVINKWIKCFPATCFFLLFFWNINANHSDWKTETMFINHMVLVKPVCYVFQCFYYGAKSFCHSNTSNKRHRGLKWGTDWPSGYKVLLHIWNTGTEKWWNVQIFDNLNEGNLYLKQCGGEHDCEGSHQLILTLLLNLNTH